MSNPTHPDRPESSDEDELRQHAETEVEGSPADNRESTRKDDLRKHTEDPAEG